jgi:uncharacterized protein (DUF1330 family)
MKNLKVDGPIAMVNLLKFKPDGGREQYNKYIREAQPFLTKHGVRVTYIGDGYGETIGPPDEEWDCVLIAEYPNHQAYLDMTTEKSYPGDVRAAALVDSRNIITSPRRTY